MDVCSYRMFLLVFVGVFLLPHPLNVDASSREDSGITSYSCFQCNTDYQGHDIDQHIGTETVSECQQLCVSIPSCFYFTYVPQWKGCYLKDSKAGEFSSLDRTLGLVSGPKSCPSLNTSDVSNSPVSCLECNTDYYGNDLRVLTIELRSAKTEEDEEQPSSSSDADRVDDQTSEWYYFTSTEPGMSRSSEGSSSYEFYEEEEESSTTTPSERRLAAFDYMDLSSGYIVGTDDSSSSGVREERGDDEGPDCSNKSEAFLECKKECDLDEECSHFSFIPQWGKCYLKKHGTGDMEGTTNYDTLGFISFVKTCFPEITTDTSSGSSLKNSQIEEDPTSSADCVSVDTDFYGHDIASHAGCSTSEECQVLCQGHGDCQFYTFATRFETCYLKFAKSLVISNSFTVGFIAGPKYCTEAVPNFTTTTAEDPLVIGEPPASTDVSATCPDGQYGLVKEYAGWDLFDVEKFSFFTWDDPTRGFVNYVDRATAHGKGMIGVEGGSSFIRVDTTNFVPYGSRGRDAVRIVSQDPFDEGLWVMSLNHMPTGCATWPAYWLVGSNPWPEGGEVDIMEGANLQSENHTALHTKMGCHMWGSNPLHSGHWGPDESNIEARDCYYGATKYNVGCAIDAKEKSFGGALNSLGGGIMVAEVHREKHIRVWFFNASDIPHDLSKANDNGAAYAHPNPDSWTKLPMATFPLGDNCNGGYFFKQLRIVLNNTFCGGFAGYKFLYELGCPGNGLDDCVKYVRNNPSAFTEAFWDINYIKVFQRHYYDEAAGECRVEKEDDDDDRNSAGKGGRPRRNGGRRKRLFKTKRFGFFYFRYQQRRASKKNRKIAKKKQRSRGGGGRDAVEVELSAAQKKYYQMHYGGLHTTVGSREAATTEVTAAAATVI